MRTAQQQGFTAEASTWWTDPHQPRLFTNIWHMKWNGEKKTKKTRDLFFNAPLTRIPKLIKTIFTSVSHNWRVITHFPEYCPALHQCFQSNYLFQKCMKEQIEKYTVRGLLAKNQKYILSVLCYNCSSKDAVLLWDLMNVEDICVQSVQKM